MALDEEFARAGPPAAQPTPARLAPFLILVAGVLGSAALWWVLRAAGHAAARSDFELRAKDRIATVGRKLAGDVEQIHSTVALFDSSKSVEPEEFETFTAGSADRHPSLVALLWVERVGEEPGEFRIRYGSGPAALARATGADLGADRELHFILEGALKKGELVGTGRLPAEVALEERPLVMLCRTASRYGTPGVVCGAIDVERLLAPEAGAAAGIELAAFDGTSGRPERVLGDLALAAPDDPFHEEPLAFADRSWSLVATLPAGVHLAGAGWRPWAAFLFGLLVTGLLFVTVVSATSQARIRELVERRTRELQKSYDTLAEEASARIWAVTETRQLEKRLREIIDLVPEMIWVKDRHGRFLLANQATAEAYGTTVAALTASGNVDVNTDVGTPSEELRRDRELMQRGLSTTVPEAPFVDAQGRRRILHVAKIPFRVFGEQELALLCVAQDITERKHERDMLQIQNRVLREIAGGAEPETVLATLVRSAEAIVPGMRCSVLLLAPDGEHLLHGYAPSLPADYNEAIDGVAIGPTIGSCGAAASTGQRVVVRDVLAHPNWEPYRELAARAGIRASWSQPIRGAEGAVLGTFAMNYGEPRTPESFEERLIESMAHMAGIAIERGRVAS